MKIIVTVLLLLTFIILSGCSPVEGARFGDTGADGMSGESDRIGGEQTADTTDTAVDSADTSAEPIPAGTDGIDVDLTELSSIMVYSEVYHMMISPDSYIGKTIKINGSFVVYYDDSTGQNYFAVIIADATACCQQGIEFVWAGEHVYPDDYPEPGSNITVTGVFETYKEGMFTYLQLIDADVLMD